MMSKLKIGLLLDSYQVPAWMLRMFEQIHSGEYAEITLVILNESEQSSVRKSFYERLRNSYRRLPGVFVRRGFNALYDKLVERHLYLPDACEPADAGSLLENVRTLTVCPIAKGSSDYFSERDLKEIRKYDLDVLYRAGFRILRGGILNAARYGVWSFHHGDNRINRGGPAGYWETMENWPETGSTLQILTEDLDNGEVLYRSLSCTDNLSVTDNRSNYYWKSLSFVPRKLRELHEVGEERFLNRIKAENRHPEFYSRRLYVEPTNRELLILTVRKIAKKYLRMAKNCVSFQQWILMFHISERFSSSLWRYKPMIPPPDRFWADPAVIHAGNMYYIFIEEFIYQTGKGHIALIRMDEKGNYTEPETIIERPYHLSYPFVFEHEGCYYLIPESVANHTIEVYKAVDFPTRWEFHGNLMENVDAVDSTLLFHGGRWWLFAGMVENPGASSWDELFLFSSDDPLSSHWTPHPENPIVSDCKNARPAGGIFSMNGELYRPAQNCSYRYGYGFNINHITQLDMEKYKESVVSRVEPDWDKRIVGTHTFSHAESLHVIDALYRRRRVAW